MEISSLGAAIDRMIGSVIQHYKIGDRLGAGGMGEVYLAEDTRLGRPVALKFLPATVEDDPSRRQRFLDEARAASSLHSSNIAAIYDIGEQDGAFFIVMEYVEGEVLSRKIERGPLPIPETLDIALQVADALDEAHARGVIHRDIKSANIIVTPKGQVKVLDFGLARFVRGRVGLFDSDAPQAPTITAPFETAPGMVLGTVSYMSPEQALAKTADHRSDIFSLGVVIFEMVAGRLPFIADSFTAIIDQVLHQPAPPLARFTLGVPTELETIIRKALEKAPELRYQTARDLYIDLRRVRIGIEAGSLAGRALQSPKLSNSIAVIAFTNIRKEPADEWIGSGIAETLMADLKNVQGLSVIGRERIFDALRNIAPIDGAGADERFAIDIGRDLGATWIVGGGYQRFGESIRITARLVDVETGTLLKTMKIDGKTTEIFDLQDRIVYELSQGLNLELNRSEIAEIERNETSSVEAYEAYARGMMMLRLGSRDSLDRAIYWFEKATEHDPNYASAWAELGDTYDLKASFLGIPELFEKALKFERRALEINPKLGGAHRLLGSTLLGMHRYEEAIPPIRRAIELEPDNASAHSALARVNWLQGKFEDAIPEFERVLVLNPEAGYAQLQLALLYMMVGDYDRAEAGCRRAIELQERYRSGTDGLIVVGAHKHMGYLHYLRHQFDDAILEYQRELLFLASTDHGLRERTSIELAQKLGAAYLRKGDEGEAGQQFARAVQQFDARVAKGADDPFTKYYVACVYALRHEVEPAMRCLREVAVFLPALTRRRAATDPDFGTMREHPDFQAFLAAR